MGPWTGIEYNVDLEADNPGNVFNVTQNVVLFTFQSFLDGLPIFTNNLGLLVQILTLDGSVLDFPSFDNDAYALLVDALANVNQRS